MQHYFAFLLFHRFHNFVSLFLSYFPPFLYSLYFHCLILSHFFFFSLLLCFLILSFSCLIFFFLRHFLFPFLSFFFPFYIGSLFPCYPFHPHSLPYSFLSKYIFYIPSLLILPFLPLLLFPTFIFSLFNFLPCPNFLPLLTFTFLPNFLFLLPIFLLPYQPFAYSFYSPTLFPVIPIISFTLSDIHFWLSFLRALKIKGNKKQGRKQS